MRRGLAILLSVAFTAGCSSSYEPARSPRIATVVEGGQPTFVKNGERIGGPAFGSGLADAVASNAEAERQATIGRNLVLGGFVLDLVGLGSVIGGTVVLAKQEPQESPSTAGTALLLGGVAAALAGSVLILCGQPHIYDAVNIYNDGLEPRPSAPPALAPAAPVPAPLSPAPAAPAPLPVAPEPSGPRASLVSRSVHFGPY